MRIRSQRGWTVKFHEADQTERIRIDKRTRDLGLPRLKAGNNTELANHPMSLNLRAQACDKHPHRYRIAPLQYVEPARTITTNGVVLALSCDN